MKEILKKIIIIILILIIGIIITYIFRDSNVITSIVRIAVIISTFVTISSYYYKPNTKCNKENLKIYKEKLPELQKEFKARTSKECYRVDIEQGQPSILDNKLGGMPYLPVGEEYPKCKDGTPMKLLLQINLKDINLKEYPNEGILEIFINNNAKYFTKSIECIAKIYKEGQEYQTDIKSL